jgi:N5-(cytidine 5'-diphosphoramidyl)-L-glutamine hydrolase
MRMVENATYPERRDAISHDWERLFRGYGMLPILIPNEIGDPTRYFELGADALLLTGGDDLGAEQQPTPRDRTENQVLAKAISLHMPIFGTCRGLQMINRHFGGRIARQLPETHVGIHDVRLSNGASRKVNSFHNEGVMRADTADGFDVFAVTDGGVVEGIRHRDLPIVAVQWHPERPSPSVDLDRALLQEWLAKCA